MLTCGFSFKIRISDFAEFRIFLNFSTDAVADFCKFKSAHANVDFLQSSIQLRVIGLSLK